MIWHRFSPFSPLPTLKLCHTPPNQFDPVFLEETISNAGFVQSILYELLYVNVFNVYDAMDAADYMLNGYFEGKIHSEISYVYILDYSFLLLQMANRSTWRIRNSMDLP